MVGCVKALRTWISIQIPGFLDRAWCQFGPSFKGFAVRNKCCYVRFPQKLIDINPGLIGANNHSVPIRMVNQQYSLWKEFTHAIHASWPI